MVTHKHHIIPRHAGGTDEPSNLVEVSVEEHAELHLALYLEHGRWQDFYAYQLLAKEVGREKAFYEMRVIAGSKPMTEEGKRKLSETLKGKVISEEQKKCISNTLKGTKQTEEHIHNANKRKFGSYCLTFSNGCVINIHKLAEWCAANGYSRKCVSNVANGVNKTHKDIISVVRLDK